MEPACMCTAQQLCDDLLTLISRIKYLMAESAEAHGLTHVQLFALFALHKQGQMAMGEAAQILHCDASNVTGIVDRLMAQGLVTREEHQADRRTKILQLTSKGSKLVDSLLAALPQRLGCDRLGGPDREVMHTIIQKMMV